MYVGQNISQLRHSIDSIGGQIDSIGNVYARELLNTSYFDLRRELSVVRDGKVSYEKRPDVAMEKPLDLDSIFSSPTPASAKSYLTQAHARAKRQKQEYTYRSIALADQAKMMRRHDIEMQKKFTLSIACIIFFFIGAPLGSIIKKGGIGTPLVISVLLFIVYFIFDNMGYKMARDGKVPVWEGIWLSTAVLLPLGVFFTYKAVGDSQVFNIDAYANFIRRLTGKVAGRTLTLKEVRMTDVTKDEALKLLTTFLTDAETAQQRIKQSPAWKRLWWHISQGGATELKAPIGTLVDYLSNSADIYVINLLNQYPFTPTSRNINVIVETTKSLIQRMDG